MGCADRALTWQYWMEGGLSVSLDESISYGSRHSLSLQGEGVIHLFKTDLTTSGAMAVDVRAQKLSTVELGITWMESPESIEWHPLERSGQGSWDRWSADVALRGRRIARVSLRTAGDGRLGRVSLRKAGRPLKPAKPAGFIVTDAGDGGDGRRHLAFEWKLQSDAAGYDVLQIGNGASTWLGRVHRDVFFAESVDPAAGRKFQLVAFGADAHRSAPAIASLGS